MWSRTLAITYNERITNVCYKVYLVYGLYSIDNEERSIQTFHRHFTYNYVTKTEKIGKTFGQFPLLLELVSGERLARRGKDARPGSARRIEERRASTRNDGDGYHHTAIIHNP